MDDLEGAPRRHLMPHFTRLRPWQAGAYPVLVRGEGAYLWDASGRSFFDGSSGLFCVNIGHGRSDLAAAAAKQAEALAFASNWGVAHPPAIEAASLVASLAPGDLDQVFFVSSGSEAVESALKFARTYHLSRGEPQRYKVIAREWAYHGSTLGALAITGIPKLQEPFRPHLWEGVVRVPNTLGCTGTDDAPSLPCLQAVEDAIEAEGPETVSMVIAEPIQNGRGALVPPPGYWPGLRQICDRYGILLCADEVINGFGRVGSWFGSERVGVVPDLLTFAKGVTSAYVPLAGFVVRGALVDAVAESAAGTFVHGSTFGGHPVATAVAVANIAALRDEKVLGNVLALEDSLAAGLAGLRDRHDVVGDTRGAGYLHAIELVASRERGTALGPEQVATLLGGGLQSCLVEAGVLTRPDDRGGVSIMVSPPLVCGRPELDDLLARLDDALTRVAGLLDGTSADSATDG